MKSLILADVHANLAALEAVLAQESDWDTMLFLGDAVVGGSCPDEVLSLLSGFDGTFIMGNHDHEVLKIDPDAPEADPHRVWM